jgi:integrase/recombinase XerC
MATSDEIEPFRTRGLPSIRLTDIYSALLADANAHNTQQARAFDMIVLGQYLGVAGPAEAADLLCSGTEGQANAVAMGFKRWMIDREQSTSTINRRICTIRKLCLLARRLGVIAWTLDVDGIPAEPPRDMSGPGEAGFRKLLDLATTRAASGSPSGLRDLAMIRLMRDNGLRVGELVALDLADIDLLNARVSITGKGRRSKSWVTINAPTTKALSDWIHLVEGGPGPAFFKITVRRPRPDAIAAGVPAVPIGGSTRSRLVTRSAYNIVAKIGLACGVKCRPHGLRHQGATRLLDITGGDVRAVQRWARHRSINIIMRYDDNRTDIAGEMARKLGDDDAPPIKKTPKKKNP